MQVANNALQRAKEFQRQLPQKQEQQVAGAKRAQEVIQQLFHKCKLYEQMLQEEKNRDHPLVEQFREISELVNWFIEQEESHAKKLKELMDNDIIRQAEEYLKSDK